MLLNFSISYSQNEIDALRYSQNNILGTAKFASLSGSHGALGGDFSCLSLNPAGIALYRNSEITFTPSISYNENTSFLNSYKNQNYTLSFDLSNFGYISVANNQHPDWKNINFGVGWNQTANFHENFTVINENNSSSLADLLLDQADGNSIENLDNFGASLAFWTDLIDLQNDSIDSLTNWYLFDNGYYLSNINSSSNKSQMQSINSYGNMSEIVLSIGSSYKENIYIGATVGIPTIEYRQYSSYSESRFEDTIQQLRSFQYNESLISTGTGFNLKLGGIIRILEHTKLGAAIHSPSYIQMQEEYSTELSTRWNNSSAYTEYSPTGYFNYEITTPWKIIGSISTIFDYEFLPTLLLNAEVEYIDYSTIRMYSDYYNFHEENLNINNLYGEARNYRIGGEVLLLPLKIRGGLSINGSPIKNKPEYESRNYSAGIGIDFNTIFIDVNYSINNSKSEHSMYNPDEERSAIISRHRKILMCTIGFRL